MNKFARPKGTARDLIKRGLLGIYEHPEGRVLHIAECATYGLIQEDGLIHIIQ